MIHNRFEVMSRVIAFGALLFVAACGQNEPAGETKTETVTAADKSAEATTASASETVSESFNAGEGTWGDIVYGADDAPVTVIEYASLTCPHCASFSMQVFPKIKKEYIDTGKVRFLYRNFLLNRVDMAASTVARCGDMEMSKKLMKVFFSRQNEWIRGENPTDGLAALARRTVNMSRVDFDRCLSNTDMHKSLVKMTADGRNEFNISGTPTIIVNDTVLENSAWETVKEAIDGKL